MNEKIRILFVDDDRRVLDGLRRMLHKMRQQWQMQFVTSGMDALKEMEEEHYDIIVSDMQMPDMNGVKLLEAVRQKYPDTIRFMLSGYTDQGLQGEASQCVHQFISKPCDAKLLKELIARTLELNARLRSKGAAEVLADIKSLPVMSTTYQEVIDMLGKPDCSLRKVGRKIAQDIGMSAKILQLVNSAFYGSGSEIADAVQAVVYLGLKTVEALILTSGVFARLPEESIKEFSVEAIQQHCVRVGALAKAICKSLQMSTEEVDMASMAGILHDAGKIVLISKMPDKLKEAIEISRLRKVPLHQIERELIDITHAEMGGCLLELWGIPTKIIEAATYHHEPPLSLTAEFSIVWAVHIANAIDHELCSGLSDGYFPGLDMSCLTRLGIAGKYQQWRKLHLPIETEVYDNVVTVG